MANLKTSSVLTMWGGGGGGGNLGYGQKRGARRVEAQWYHVRCYTLGGGGQNDTRGSKNDTRGGRMSPPP